MFFRKFEFLINSSNANITNAEEGYYEIRKEAG